MILTVILIMFAFGLIIHIDECKERGTKSVIDKLGDWWCFRMKSRKTGGMIKICLMAVIYFLIRLILR